MPKQRSRRLQKKLRTGAYRQGFWFSSALPADLDVGRELELRYGFIAFLERQGLVCLGSVEEGFVARSADGSATDADRDAVRAWLGARAELRSVEVGPLAELPMEEAEDESLQA